jgi:hypothetical protein
MSLVFPNVNVWIALTIEHVHEEARIRLVAARTGNNWFLRLYSNRAPSIAYNIGGHGRKAAHDDAGLECVCRFGG